MDNPASTSCEVAVILPCYNVEPYLERALKSVLAQTFRDFHIYGVDDHSTDATANLLYACPKCSVSHAPRRSGAAAARNQGIRISRSPFVAFLDADDEWLPGKLERQLALLKQNPNLGMVCSYCSHGDAARGGTASLPPQDMPPSGHLFEYLARRCFVYTPTVIVRRACLESVGLFNEQLQVSEDFNLWLRIAAAWPITIVPEVLAITHSRPGCLSVDCPVDTRLANGVACLDDVHSRCPNLSPRERRSLRLARAQRLYFYGSHLLSAGKAAPSRTNFIATLRLQLTHWRALVKLLLGLFPAAVTSRLLHWIRTRRPAFSADPIRSLEPGRTTSGK